MCVCGAHGDTALGGDVGALEGRVCVRYHRDFGRVRGEEEKGGAGGVVGGGGGWELDEFACWGGAFGEGGWRGGVVGELVAGREAEEVEEGEMGGWEGWITSRCVLG